MYPPLVIPAAHTRLAVPVSPLMGHEQFEVDVLGLSGTWAETYVKLIRRILRAFRRCLLHTRTRSVTWTSPEWCSGHF